MGASAVLEPQEVEVNRSELRQNQKAVLRRAKGRTVVVVRASDEGDEKVVLDKDYFEEVLRRMRALRETLEITMDERLYSRILTASETLDEDIRLGKLLSTEDAFRED